jgi:hypothetical protein
MATRSDTEPKPDPPKPPVGSVKAFPQTIFISEKPGTEPAPPPDR